MKSRLRLATLAAALALATTVGFAGPLRGQYEAKSAPDPTLIGGQPADPKAWPASVYARMNGAACSATIVADRTLLIAAHCVNHGGKAEFTLGSRNYSSTCSHSEDYRNDPTSDWALCLIDSKVTGVPFESVATDGGWCAKGKTARLTGYGCTKEGGGGGNDGIYRIGTAPVTRCPTTSSNDVITKGQAALCFGDSGGPAFWEPGDGTRVLFGVNSRGNIKDESYLSALWTPKGKKFLAAWQAANSQVICGYPGATGCRGGASPPPPPPPPPPPAPCSGEVAAAVTAQAGAGAALAKAKACLKL